MASGARRVLIADDHQAVRHMLRLRLQAAGCEVVGEAADGAEAVHLAREASPDVVVMDVTMPVMDGIEATRRIKEEAPEIEVIGYSAAADAEATKRLLAAGAGSSFQKDDFAGLVAAITAP